MKRPGVVWAYSTIITIGILWELFGFIAIMARSLFFGLESMVFSSLIIASSSIAFILLVLRAIMIFNFFNLKKNTILWAHIYFGAAIAIEIIISAITNIYGFSILIPGFSITFFSALFDASVSMKKIFIFDIALPLFFWWAVVNYVKKKQVEGRQLFN